MTATYEENMTIPLFFSAETFLQFLPSPINVLTNPIDFATIITPTSLLDIDLTNSYTSDGITVGAEGWEWEWEWRCIIPKQEGGGGGGLCRYADGSVMEMPGREEGQFVGGGPDGREFMVGMPLYFVVKMRILDVDGGGVVAEGRWEKMINVLEREESGLVIEENEWMCEGGAVGYLVFFFFLFFFIVCFGTHIITLLHR